MRRGFTLIELAIVIVILLLIGSIVVSHYGRSAQKKEACAKLWTIARTAQDSIQVIKTCEIPEPEQPVIIQQGYNRY